MELIKCAFCGKTQGEVPLMIHHAVRNAAICSDCTSACMEVVNKKLVVPVMDEELQKAKGLYEKESMGSVKQKNEHGRVIEIRFSDAPLAFINTKTAVAYDYLQFMEGVISALLNDRDSLENEANKCGRTINGHGFSGIGSVNIPQVPDEQINSDL